MEDEFGEGIGNPFDTPVPGQSLTDKPGNYPWEHPPAIAQPDDAADYIWDKITEPERAEEIIAMLDAGVPVEAIGRSILFGGFIHGLINGYSLKNCGMFGSICAGHIITKIGSRPQVDLKKIIEENI